MEIVILIIVHDTNVYTYITQTITTTLIEPSSNVASNKTDATKIT